MALIPEFKLSTEKARSVLPKEISLKDGIYNVGRTALLVSAFANGNYNLLKYAMKDKFHQAYRSSLIEGYDKVIKESMELGALGCFLSGAGPTIMTVVGCEDKAFKSNIEKFIKENNLKYNVVYINDHPRHSDCFVCYVSCKGFQRFFYSSDSGYDHDFG